MTQNARKGSKPGSGSGRPPRNDRSNPRRNDGDRSGGGGRRRDDARGGGGRPRQVEPEFEYVLVTPQGCASLPILDLHLPPLWKRIPDSPFFKPGLYLKGGGGLSKVRNETSFDPAVLVAAWEDPDFLWPVGGRDAKVGQHALFLFRSEAADGPPWLPLWGALRGDAADFTDGIFGGLPDPERPTRWAAEISVDRDKVTVRHTRPVADDDGTAALIETLRWLAARPDDTSPGAAALRNALVRGGHGLQRLGVALAWEERDVALELAREVLAPLCPAPAHLLLTLADLFRPDADDTRERFVALVKTLADASRPDARTRLSRGDLAVLATWMHGLFGLRPERENAQPARTLLLASRLARGFWNHLDALDHPDAPIPNFPLAPADLHRAFSDLSVPRFAETDLEVLIRGMATAETGYELRAPRLEYLATMRAAWQTVYGYPVAGRSFAGRHDYLLSLASFRRLDARDTSLSAEHLIIEQPSVASSRAYGRLTGNGSEIAAPLAELLGASTSAVARHVAEALTTPLDEALDRLEEVAGQRCTPVRQNAAGALLERLVAASENGHVELRRPVPEPDLPTETTVRAHYLYWRQYCRSIVRSQPDAYAAFLERWLPETDALPPKLQRELFALARTWLRLDRAHVERAEFIREAVARHLERVDGTEGSWDSLRGELVEILFTLAAELDPPTLLAAFERLVATPDWEVRDAARLLETTRNTPSADALVSAPVYRTLHRQLAAGTSGHATLGRAEWLRRALQPAKRYGAIQWLLDSRRNSAFLSTTAFRDFFADDAPRAIDHPDDALVRLLELALAHAPDELEDELASAVSRATHWSPEVAAATLRDAGRFHAAASVLLRRRAGTRSDAVQLARKALGAARNGASLLRAAEAIVSLRVLWSDLDEEIAGEVATAFADWAPTHRLADGAQQGMDAWRLLHAMDAAAPPEHVVEVAVRTAILQRWAPSATAFVQEAITREVLGVLDQATRSDVDLSTLALESAVLPLWRRMAKEARGAVRTSPARLLRDALADAALWWVTRSAAEQAGTGDTGPALALLERLAGANPDEPELQDEADATAELTTDSVASPPSDDGASDDGASEDGASDEGASADATSEDAPDATEADGAPAGRRSRGASSRRGGQAPEAAFDARPALSRAASHLLPLVRAGTEESGALASTLRALAARDEVGYPVESHVVGIAASAVLAAGGRLRNEHRPRRIGSLRIDLSAARWSLLLQFLSGAIQAAEHRPELEFDDRRAVFALRAIALASADDSTDDDESEFADDDTREDDAASEEDGAEEGAVSDSADGEADDAGERPLLARIASAVKSAGGGDAGLAGLRTVEAALPLLAQRMPLLTVRFAAKSGELRLDPRGGRGRSRGRR